MPIVHHDTYASAGAWYAVARENFAKPIPRGLGSRAIMEHRAEDWNGNVDMAGALVLADKGWADGRAKMALSVTQAIARTQSMRTFAHSMDVGGAYPDVPLAVAGEPACMVTLGPDMLATRPIVRLVCEQWISAGIEPEYAMNRGAAIVAHVDRLEEAGIRCEIVARFSCSGASSALSRKADSSTITDVLAKTCDAPVDMDKLAYLMAHPSAIRWLYFRSLEYLPGDLWKQFVPGYGAPPRAECRTVEPGQIFLPSANEHTDKYATPESAARFVGELLQAGIRSMRDCGFWPADHSEPELVDAE